jgi:DNA-binding PadR family transcriptional regulator
METIRLTVTEGALLGMLAQDERSGYELSRRIEDSIGYLWSPSRSQIYRVLPRLVERGLARSREVEQRGRPDKALYALTPAGGRALRAWLEEVEDEPADRTVYPLKLFFCDFASPEAALAQLAAYRRYLERLLARYREIDARPADSRFMYPKLVLAHGIARVTSTVAWIDDAAAAIEQQAREGADRTRPIRT